MKRNDRNALPAASCSEALVAHPYREAVDDAGTNLRIGHTDPVYLRWIR